MQEAACAPSGANGEMSPVVRLRKARLRKARLRKARLRKAHQDPIRPIVAHVAKLCQEEISIRQRRPGDLAWVQRTSTSKAFVPTERVAG